MNKAKNLQYSLDTSALLDGRIRYYPPDIFPQLWGNFEALIDDGKIKACELVHKELKKKDDGTCEWLKSKQLDHIFVEVDEEIQKHVSDIMTAFPKLVSEGGQRSFADPFVIAFARQNGCMVVTGEVGGSEKSPRIPYVCQKLDIKCINFLDLIRLEKWQF